MRCCLMSEPCPLPSCPAVPAKPWAATVSDGCPCTEEFSSNVDYDEDCTEQWRRLHRTMKKSFMYYPHSKRPILFLQHLSLLTCHQRSWGRVGWWLEPLYLSHSIYLFLYFSFSFSLLFSLPLLLLPPESLTPSNFIELLLPYDFGSKPALKFPLTHENLTPCSANKGSTSHFIRTPHFDCLLLQKPPPKLTGLT